MKRAAILMLSLLVAITVVACGGSNAKGNTPTNASHEHGDDHGKMKEIGKKKVGDRDVTVSVSEWDVGKEGVAEVAVSGDGADKLAIKAWIAGDDGKEASPKATGSWAADEKMFDCHIELGKDLKPGKYKLWISVGDAKESWDVEVHKD